MLRGTTSAVSLEQSTDATGAIQQHVIMDRVLLQDTTTTATTKAVAMDVDVESIALEAAQLYPFVTEKPPRDPHAQAFEAAEQVSTDNYLKNTVELPPDPLDSTWGKPIDRDRTLVGAAEKIIAADFGAPSRLMQSQSEQLALLSVAGGGGAGMAALSMMAADSIMYQQLHQQFPVLLLGGLLAFAVAGVIVNRMRRSSQSNKHHRQPNAFDDEKEIFESDDENEEGYALFS